MIIRFARTALVLALTAAWVAAALWLPSAPGLTSAAAQAPPNGAALYQTHCASCHDAPEGRTPGRDALRARTGQAILTALEGGTMAVQGQALNAAERRAVAAYLGAGGPAQPGTTPAPVGACGTNATPFADPRASSHWTSWGYDLSNSRYQPSPGLTAADVPKLTLKWAFGFPNGTQAFSQPTIASGRIFTGSDNGTVYALDAETGCTHWTFRAERPVRTAVTIAQVNRSGQARFAAFFGDIGANVYALDAATGDLLWKVKADNHRLARITGAPVFHDNRLFVPVSSVEEASAAQPNYPCCSFRGSVVAYDAATGDRLWRTFTIANEPREVGKTSVGTPIIKDAGAAVWNSPTIDVERNALYFGTGNAYTQPAVDTSDAVMALDLATGRRLWVNQLTPSDAFVMNCRPGAENCPGAVGPDFDFGNAPILRRLSGGGSIIVIGQKSGMVYGLNPADGRKIWEFRAGQGTALGGMEWGSAADDRFAYIPVSDVLRSPADAGGIFALGLETGERAWHTPAPPLACTTGRGCTGAQSAPASVMPGVVFSGSMDGHFRAYSTFDGKIIWDFDTAREFQTVNGVPARGGSIDAAGPAIAGGLVVTPSGYALFRGTPGNVLLVFSVPK